MTDRYAAINGKNGWNSAKITAEIQNCEEKEDLW